MALPVIRTATGFAADQPGYLVVLVGPGEEGPSLPRGLPAVLAEVAGPGVPVLLRHLDRAADPTRGGALLEVPVADGPLTRVALVGRGTGAADAMRRAGAAVGRTLRAPREDDGPVAVVGFERVGPEGVRAFAEGLMLAAYSFRVGGPAPLTPQVALAVPASREEAVRRATVTARAVHLARDLANTPASTKSPAWLAEQATAVARSAGVAVRVLDEGDLAAQGFGGILAVGMGSVRPPRLVELSYVPVGTARARLQHLVLIGKGITFDSGGISLKPPESMPAMKTDMAGAAAVLAVVAAAAELQVPVRVSGLLACAENLPSGSAMRPSDVITHYGGRTVEVLNTDAEGRLVLADCLAYADARLRPDFVVDIATLTGAVGVALGRRDAAMFATDDGLAKALERAAEASGERLWRMPFVEDYRPAVDSDVADLANVAVKPARFSAGSIVAALFLREFAGGRAWAHLDIAATGRADAESEEITKGATGFGVRLLLRWLESA